MKKSFLINVVSGVFAAALITGSSLTAFAADISNVPMYGYDSLSQETQLKINEVFQNISDDTIKLYNAANGKIEFVKSVLDRGNGKESDVMGLYFFDDSKIQIRADDVTQNNPSTYIPGSVAHEIGHFVYHKTYPFLSEESKETLSSCYSYWSQYSPECYNEDETFATMYAWEKADMHELDENTLGMIHETETICGILAEYIENGQEVGPGIDITAAMSAQ